MPQLRTASALRRHAPVKRHTQEGWFVLALLGFIALAVLIAMGDC